MKRPELVVLAILVVISLVVSAVWAHRWQAHVAQSEEMRALYAFGSGGDLDKVKRLSEYPSPEAIQWLEKLAQQRDATGDSRVAAITALGGKASLNRAVLSRLLRIDQPFVVRHAAAGVLEQRGCDDLCILTALYELNAIWKGQPAIEAAPSTKELERKYSVHPAPDLERRTLAELRDKTEQDYLKLLNAKACETRKALTKDYSAEPAFIEQVQSKVGPC